MSRRLTIPYYYVTPGDLEKLHSFKTVSGDKETTLVTQFVRGWISRNRDYYLNLARMDAEAREVSFSEWGQIVVEKGGIEELPPPRREIVVPPSPLRDIVLPENTGQQKLNYIFLGNQNVALVKVGVYYERVNLINFVSRIVREHMERNWEKLYLPQVEAEDFNNWK